MTTLDRNFLAKAVNLTDLKHLDKIDLEFKGLRKLEKDVFKYIPNLKYIILGNNEISDIDSRTFEGLSDVLGLTLNDNKIGKINDTKLFSETKNLV